MTEGEYSIGLDVESQVCSGIGSRFLDWTKVYHLPQNECVGKHFVFEAFGIASLSGPAKTYMTPILE